MGLGSVRTLECVVLVPGNSQEPIFPPYSPSFPPFFLPPFLLSFLLVTFLPSTSMDANNVQTLRIRDTGLKKIKIMFSLLGALSLGHRQIVHR